MACFESSLSSCSSGLPHSCLPLHLLTPHSTLLHAVDVSILWSQAIILQQRTSDAVQRTCWDSMNYEHDSSEVFQLIFQTQATFSPPHSHSVHLPNYLDGQQSNSLCTRQRENYKYEKNMLDPEPKVQFLSFSSPNTRHSSSSLAAQISS